MTGKLEKGIIIASVGIIIAGFMLHMLTPLRLYGFYYGTPLLLRTILPAVAYGMTLLLIGVAYLRGWCVSSIIIMSILLILSNSIFAFFIYDFISTPYGPELALEVYFFIAQTLVYPWIIANVAGIFFFARRRSTSVKTVVTPEECQS